MKTILFVCHGNICRSIAAETILKSLLTKKGIINEYHIYSRATSFDEIGNDIYPPMKEALARRGYSFRVHKAVRITKEDFEKADAIYYMDEQNALYLNMMFNDKNKKFHPLVEFAPSLKLIDDPWYTRDFDKTIDELETCLKELTKRLN